jgi:hypothetical protein
MSENHSFRLPSHKGVADRADLPALLADPTGAAEVPVEHVPALLGDLERLKATLWARLFPQGNGHAKSDREPPYTLTEAAGLLLKSPAWLRRQAKVGSIPCAQKVGKSWVFPRELFDRFRQRREVG